MEPGENTQHSGARHQAPPPSSPSTPHKSHHKTANNHSHKDDHDHDNKKKSSNPNLSSRKHNSNKDHSQNQHHLQAVQDSHHGQYNHHNHPHSSMGGMNGLMMLIDGLGLALITAATILESYELWRETYNAHWPTNVGPISLWLAGKSCQIVGLLFLIGK